MAFFLDKKDNLSTRALYELCFPDEDFASEYYGAGGEALKSRIAVSEREGSIVSMAQLVRRRAVYKDGSRLVWFITGVCTHPEMRHRGLMDEVMNYVLSELKKEGEEWCFLMPVDMSIYRHLGFVYDFRIRNSETLELLYADEGLELCSACLLCGESFEAPEDIAYACTEKC